MNVSRPAGMCASYHTLSGSQHGRPPVHHILARAGAAHAAGIPYVGVCSDDLIDADPWWLQRSLHDAGVAATSAEWVSLDELDPACERRLFKLADVFHTHRIAAGVCGTRELDMHAITRRLRHLAHKAADHEVTIVVEPVIFGTLGTIDMVQHLVEDAGEPNVGTLLDTFHHARAGWSPDVSHIIPELVGAVQVCGVDWAEPAPAWPDGLFHEAQCGRRLPHEGDFPVVQWLRNLLAAGVDAPIEVEVISSELRGMELYNAAAAVAASWSQVSASLAGSLTEVPFA